MKFQIFLQVWMSMLFVVSSAATHVRFNEAGYFPAGTKRFVVMADENVTGQSWVLSQAGADVLKGTLGASEATKGYYSPFAYNYSADFSSVTTPGEYDLAVAGSAPVKITIGTQKYAEIISSSLRWLRVQRSGTTETLDHGASHRGDSAVFVYRNGGSPTEWVEDTTGLTLNMQGGWYAGGNYGKFTSAVAYTSYNLLKAYETNPSLFTKKWSTSNLVDVLDETKFGLSYLLKIMPNDKEFIIQVGGFDSDNGIRLPEKDLFEGKRAAYSAFSEPDMGLAIAALATGARVFKSVDDAFALRCKTEAEKIYAALKKGPTVVTWLEKDYDLFKDDSPYDNLLLGAAEMYQLTGDQKYLADAKVYSGKAKNAWWAGWNVQNMMAHSLISKDDGAALKFMEKDLSEFFTTSKKSDNLWGMPIDYSFSGLYTSNIIGIAAARFEMVSGKSTYRPLLQEVVDYGYGINNWGVSFTASPILKNSVKNFNLPIYKLQTRLFPEGATAVGPCDAEGHDGESKWILDDIRANYCYPFNTKEGKFYDHGDDYMTMEAWIYGAAENIYLLTLATTLLSK